MTATTSDPEERSQHHIAALLKEGRLETMQSLLDRDGIEPDRLLIDASIQYLAREAKAAHDKGEIRWGNRLDRRAGALTLFADYGLDPERLIRQAVLPLGYCGKILLISIDGGIVPNRICLRSGDQWHREILNDAMEEMADLGFENVAVEPAGGAWVRFKEREELVIYGGSDDFGTCNKQTASILIASLYPNHKIWIET